ncbi:MAG: hypothetical protein R3E32_19330 [Chitinophagales bacterium]
MPTKIISLWSGPRNISTALMYSFAQRADTQVVDEPLYAHYLQYTGIVHPGNAEILASMETDGEQVMQQIFETEYSKSVVFLKQMAKHLVGLSETWLLKGENIFLIRDPKSVIVSFAKVTNPTFEEVGIKQQYDLHQFLVGQGKQPIVLDSKEILLNPQGVLQQLCERLEIPFEEDMLQWKEGAIPEDGVWAKYWYKNVHHSTGFKPYQASSETIPSEYESLLEQCQSYYDFLYYCALKS